MSVMVTGTVLKRCFVAMLLICWSCNLASSFNVVSSRFLSMKGKSDDTPKKYTKSNLPSKDCIVCKRPFEWRKKWERCWDEVKYCSERCRRDGKGSGKDDSSNSKMTFSFDDNVEYKASSFYSPTIFGAVAMSTPVSQQQRDILRYQETINKGFKLAAFALGVGATGGMSTAPSKALAAGGTNRPSKREIEEMFLDGDWGTKASVLRKSSYRRLDEQPDSFYYVNPRFVEHIDDKAVAALLGFHKKELRQLSQSLYKEDRKLDILDLCSSWVSHLPPSDYPPISRSDGGSGSARTNRVVGLGMNKAELDRNPQLSESLVRDLNIDPTLPFETNSFDAIFVQLSIDYLTKPLDVLSEAGRVLRPGGAVYITFSNRVFIDKAIAGWTGKADVDHIQTVGDYLHHSTNDKNDIRGRWKEPYKAVDLSPSQSSDPLYAVIAHKE